MKLLAFLLGSLLEAQTIVTFGDSLTAPRAGVVTYSDLLAERLGPAVKVVNRGVPGNTSEQARARFAREVLAAHPDLVIIQLGTNDSAVDVWKDPPASAPRVEVARFRANLQYFVKELRAAKCRVILLTPSRLAWTPKLRQMYGRAPYDPESEDGFNVMLDVYSDVVRGLALREKLPLADTAPVLTSAHLLDGMHPSSAGHRLVSELLLPLVRRELSRR